VTRREEPRTGPTGQRAAAVLLLVLLGLLVGAGAASAHADLESSSPAAGAEVPTSPGVVTLRFSEGVSLVSGSVVVLDAQGRRVDAADARHPASDSATVVATLRPALPIGTYTVQWHVLSDDSHPVSGSFTFGVGVVPTGAPAGGAAGAPADAGSTDGVVTGLHWVAQLLALAGTVVLAGGVFFVVWLWPEGRSSTRGRRVLAAAWASAVAGNLLLLLVAGAYGTGGRAGDLLDPATTGDALGTTSARLTALRLAVLVLALFWWRHLGRTGRLPTRFDTVGVWLVVAITQSGGGHPGHSASPLLTSLVDAAHLTAVSIWVGGLVMLGAAHLGRAEPRQPASEPGTTVLPTWSRVAAGAVAVIALTGAASALVQVGSWAALAGTTYGRLVLGKVALLVLILAVAVRSRRLVARLVRGTTARRLRRLVAAETGAALVVLALSAALVSTAPARETYVPTMATTVSAHGATGDLSLQVTVRPTTPGFEGLTVHATSPAGQALPIQSAQVRFTNTAQHIGPMDYPVRTTPGAGVEDALISVPAPGRWDVQLRLEVGGRPFTGAFSYTVDG
jgi:copper transport protein